MGLSLIVCERILTNLPVGQVSIGSKEEELENMLNVGI